MTHDERVREYMQRFHKPDGNCLQCGHPANRLHPVGLSRSQNLNLTTATTSGRMSFAAGNVSPTGPLRRPVEAREAPRDPDNAP